MSSMKDPSLSYIRSRTRTPTLKLIVSFNGAFCRRPPHNRLRYTGGETRIISLDCNISFSKLKAKIMTDLVRPKAAVSGSQFSLKYYISEASLGGGDGKDGETPILISLDTDDDVRSMVEDYETMEFNGMFLKRLWVFVCYDSRSNGGSDDCGFVNTKLENSESNGFYEVKQGFAGIQGNQRLREDEGFLSEDLLALLGKGRDYKATDNRSKKFHDDSLRKTVLRQQLLAKKFDEICIFRGLDGQSEMELAGENGVSESPLIDLCSGPESPSSESKKLNYGRDVGRKVTDNKYVYPRKMPREGSEKVLSVKQFNSLPLNSKDGNLHAGLDGLEGGFSGHTRKIIGGNNICNLESRSEFGAAGHTSNLSHYSGPSSKSNGLETIYNSGRVVQPLLSYKNRENIMPYFGEPGDNVARGNLYFTPSDHNQLIGTPNPFKPGQEGYQGNIHSHKCSSSEVRCHRICRSHFKIRNNRNFGLDGKFYPWLNSKATIPKQGPGLRTCVDVCSIPFTDSCYCNGEEVDGRDCRPNNQTKLVNLPHHGQDEIPMTTGFLGDLKPEGVNPGKGYIDGGSACAEDGKSPISFVTAVSSLPHVKTVCTQIPTGPGGDEYHIPSQALTVKTPGVAGIIGKAPSDISEGVNLRNQEDEQTAMSQNPPHLNSCHPNNLSNSGGTELSYNYVHGETETAYGSTIYKSSVYTWDDHSASPVNLSPCNLSLELGSKLQQSAPPSARIDNSHILLTPQSNNLDLMDEQHLKSGPKVENSSDLCSSSSSEKAAKMGNNDDEKQEVQRDIGADLSIQEKHKKEITTECLKANKGALPADVYSHSVTRELQNIRNSDLECIKELGSGTFGTVYHGKWKGSDVAIKRINPSYFANGAKEEDRLLADFWKEANILGQLRHPNIVALYGVASDGPLNSLATVTEYMVNGSLKQVLRKKDRTIDRRKRLIIAMDATCGMEYLHGKNIVHFDLKSHNFLVNMRDPQRPICKIGDLGLSKIKQRTLVSGGVRGTIPWMAPELLNGTHLVSEKVDVYSFGIVLWELLTGEEPYETMRSDEIIAGIIRGDLRPEVPSWCDPAWRSLMERCWSSDPNSRPAFSDIAKELRSMAASMKIK